MGLMREQFTFTLLFILFAIGCITHNVNGVCYRPVFTNPYAIAVEPDKDVYADFDRVELGCEEGHTPYGLPDNVYCSSRTGWDPDPSTGLCFAQCNITQLIEDDDIKAIDDNNKQQTIFNHGEIAYFECTDKGQFAGSDQGTCDNGTIIVITSDPTCLVYCPVLVDEDGMIGDGLYYETVDAPVINETSIIYYRDDDEITYKCLDGYVGPQNCSTSDCRSTCEDGSWIPDPPDIPVCADASTTTSDASTAASDPIVITSDTTTFRHIATTATSLIPTAQDTTVSPTTVSETTTFTTALPETTEIDPDPTTTPEAKEPTSLPTTKHNTPLGTEEPGSTPLPCGGECEASEVCNGENICECRPDFYPDEDDICRVSLSFDVNITITEINGAEANYTEDLNNDTTKEFKQLEEGVCQPINEVYGNDTEYVGCQVLEFSEGSIKVNYILNFVENSTQNSTTVDQTIQDELSKSDGAFTGNFTFDSSSLAVERISLQSYQQLANTSKSFAWNCIKCGSTNVAVNTSLDTSELSNENVFSTLQDLDEDLADATRL
ncbi:uncharacterized protein LOC135156714 [Lytechinus pictus]|uniref:uncharacterized protein LOC135156714 n=1 Tax=Lytechinus pictus TaxID=7653 RepID=UPI0030BA257D